MENLPEKVMGRGKPGVAGFRGLYRAHRGDDIRRSSGHTSKDIAKYLGVSRATLYRYLAEDNAAA
jgi:predicted transcriptional regulator